LQDRRVRGRLSGDVAGASRRELNDSAKRDLRGGTKYCRAGTWKYSEIARRETARYERDG
jgi:hypothetical protein